MDIIEQAAKALEPLAATGIPVQQGWYDEKLKKTHITLWNLSDSDAAASDDEPDTEDAYLQINIWATYDAVDLKKRVKRLLQQSGFIYEDGQDVQETPEIYNKAMRFYKIEEAEMEE